MRSKSELLFLLTISVLFILLQSCKSDIQYSMAKDRINFNAKFEPQNGVLHGAGQDINSFIKYGEVVGKNYYPKIYMTYISIVGSKESITDWGDNLKKELSNLPNDLIPQIGLNITSGNDDGSGQDKDVAEGKYDDNIDELFEKIKELNKPTFLRIGYEFEGSWNGYSPKYYKEVFANISDKIKNDSAKIATVWCAAGGSAGFIPFDSLMQYYPGDEYVDWWGVDIFSPEEITNNWLVEFYKKSEEHKKPIMLGETTPRFVGVDRGEESWNKWFDPFFNMIYKNPVIKAYCYINWDWKYWSDAIGFSWHDWEDARIEKNEFISKRYKQELLNPIFIHSKTK